VLLAGVAGGIAFPILPIVGVQAGLSLPLIGVILASNRAMRVLTSPIVGALADRFGGRRTLIAGLVLQIAVMLLYTLGITTGHPGTFFLLGRMLHGPGSACVFVAGQALALHAGGKTQGGRTAGTVRAAMGVGVPLGLVAGGLVSDRWGNAATFESALVGILVATLVAWRLVPDLRVAVARRFGWSEIFKAMADRRLSAIGALTFAVAFSAQGMVLTTLSLLAHARGMSLLGFGDQGTSSVLMGLMVVVSAITMPVAGCWGDRHRAHAPIALAGLIVLVPSLVLIALSSTATGLVAGIALMGLGSGALSPSLLALVSEWVPQDRRGVAIGVLQLWGDIGGTLGPLVGTALFAGSLRAPYLVTAVLLACFILLAARLVRWNAIA